MPPSSSHRPRRKRRLEPPSNSNNGTITLDVQSKREKPAFPLVAFFWPARSSTSQWVLLPCILMITGLFRWCTGMWPYSGYRTPPLFGDFEAQRHWMEITINLPVSHWYWHDPDWWRLDYPPLTAYHSWLCGKIGNAINPRWFALYLSRGLEDMDLKVFMRATVIVSEYLIYVPALVICVRHMARLYNISPWESSIALTAILMQPATILVDHAHFQYNTVMLGFTLATISSFLDGHLLWSCGFFVAALGFKQMALFYAPAVAAYLAGKCFFPRLKPARLIEIALATLASFAVLYLPFLLGVAYNTYRSIPLPSDIEPPPLLQTLPFQLSEKSWYYPYILQLAQSISRIFPLQRGIFEDKVANIWSALHSSGIHKLNIYSTTVLSRAALLLTLVSITPPCLIIFLRPKRDLTPLTLATSAWGFFLCSYQVHEKNVLLPLLPMTLLLATKDGMKPATRAWIGYANLLGRWTMFPLLARVGLRVPYIVLNLLWIYLLGFPPLSFQAYDKDSGLHWITKVLHLSIYSTVAIWHVVEFFVPPPEKMPDLWTVICMCIGAAGFGTCYLWCLWRLAIESSILEDVGIVAKAKAQTEKKRQ